MRMLADVIEVKPLKGHQLFVRFEDGVEGIVDLARLVPFEGVFAPLKEPDEFRRVAVHPELGVLYWPNGADLDPDVLHAEITGQPIKLRSQR